MGFWAFIFVFLDRSRDSSISRHTRLDASRLDASASRGLDGLPPMQFGGMPTHSIPSCAQDPVFGTCIPTNNYILTKGTDLIGVPFTGRYGMCSHRVLRGCDMHAVTMELAEAPIVRQLLWPL